MIHKFYSYIFFCTLIIQSCHYTKPKNIEREKDTIDSLQSKEIGKIQTFIIKDIPFYKELVSNGKIFSINKSDLKFESQGNIISIFVTEGQYVRKGQLIASLDEGDAKTALHEAELNHRKSILDYEDQLLQLGHRMTDTITLDGHVKNIAKLRSGFSQSSIALSRAKHVLSKTRLYAPYDGMIANLKARPYNPSSAFDMVCTIVSTTGMQVEFKVLEQELGFVRFSKHITISPFSDVERRYEGSIVSINPVIDAGGMLTVKASIQSGGGLIDGMGAQVYIRQEMPRTISIPKEAVLDRQGRKVVFTVKEGRAQWNYVTIAHENSTHYSLSDGLSLGDEVIYKGNFNLAHDSKVYVSK